MAMSTLFSISPNLRLLAGPSPGTGDRRSARLSLSPPVQPVKTTKAVIFGGRTNLLAPVKASQNEDAEPDCFGGASNLEFLTSPMYFSTPMPPKRGPDDISKLFTELRSSGIRGLLIHVRWDFVESEPSCYTWDYYMNVMKYAQQIGLKVRVAIHFHDDFGQRSKFPTWVKEEMARDEDLCFHDKNGKKYRDYISFGAEEVARLRGRTPVQIYSDFIKSFAETLKEYMGGVIQDVHIALGPEGELKYPSGKSHTGSLPPLFKCHDKYMLSEFRRFAEDSGVPEWGLTIPDEEICEASASMSEECAFFLKWYSSRLLRHAETILSIARLSLPNLPISTKVASDYELLSNFYPRAMAIFNRHGITICCSLNDYWDENKFDKMFQLWMGETGNTIAAIEVSLPFYCYDNSLAARLARIYKILKLYNSMYPVGRGCNLSISFTTPHFIEWFHPTAFRRFLRTYYRQIMG